MVQEEPRVPNKTQSKKVKFEKFLNRLSEITELLEILTEKAKECNIRRSTVRQLCMPLFKKLVAGCTASDLGEICSQGNSFEPVPFEYRESHIVTHGTNAWSSIFLSTSNSGLVLLQKIAVASLLSDVCETIIGIIPESEITHGLMPIEIITVEQISRLSQLDDELIKQMGW